MKKLLLPLLAGLFPLSLSAQLLINEVLADPPSDSNGDGVSSSGQDEFVEFVNTSGAVLDLEGWTVSDGIGVKHTFTGPTLLEDGAVLVLFGGGEPTGSFGGATVMTASGGSLGLNNSGDTITVADSEGVEMAFFEFGSEGGNDTSLTRDPDLTGATFVEHDSLGNGSLSFSPGLRNDGSPLAGDGLTLVIDPAVFSEGAGAGAASATVTRTGDLSAALTVMLVSSDPSEAVVPASVEILPGQESATFLVDAVDDMNQDGTQMAILTASATELFSASVELTVNDDEVFAFPDVVFSEIRIDQTDTDTDEFVEFFSSAPDVSLDRLTLVVLGDGAGGSGVVEEAVDLSGQSLSGNYFLVGESSLTIATPDFTTPLAFENNDNVTFLLVGDFIGARGDDLDTNDDGTLDVMPWSVILDGLALIKEVNPPSETEFEYATGLGFVTVGPFESTMGIAPPYHVFRGGDGGFIIGLEDVDEDTPGFPNPRVDLPLPEEVAIIGFRLEAGGARAVILATGLGSRVWRVQASDDLGDADSWADLSGGFVEGDQADGTTIFSFSTMIGEARQFYRLIEQE